MKDRRSIQVINTPNVIKPHIATNTNGNIIQIKNDINGLPPGWEAKRDLEGRIYFVDHINRYALTYIIILYICHNIIYYTIHYLPFIEPRNGRIHDHSPLVGNAV